MVINLFYEMQVMSSDNKKKTHLSIVFEIWLGQSFKNNTRVVISELLSTKTVLFIRK